MIIFRNRAFGLLWTSGLLSSLGNWLMIVAVPVYVYNLTGSTLSSGFAFVAETVPAMLFGPLAGVLVDRWDRRTVMIVADLTRMVTVLALILVDDASLLWILYLAVFIESSIGQFFGPAAGAVVPAIVGRDGQLESASTWNTVANGIVRLAGAPIGGALYVAIGFDWLVLIDAGTYLGSALLIALMGRLPRPVSPENEPRVQLWREARAGAAYLVRHRLLRGLLLVSSLFLLANAVLSVLLVPYVVTVLHGNATDVGVLMSVLGVGFLLSAFLGNRLSLSGRLRAGVTACLVATTAFFAGLFLIPDLATALVFTGLIGVPAGAVLMLIQVQVQRQTPDHQLGRVGSAFSSIEMAATTVGGMAGSLLGETLSLTITVYVVLALVLISALLAAVLLPARVLTTDPHLPSQVRSAAGAADQQPAEH